MIFRGNLFKNHLKLCNFAHYNQCDFVSHVGEAIQNFLMHKLKNIVIVTLHFLCLFTIFFSAILWNNENVMFKNINRACWSTTNHKGDTAFISSSTRHIFDMMNARRAQFHDKYKMSFEQKLFRSVNVDLMYGGGACGGYSKVLARHLQLNGFKVRIAQLKVPVVGYGGHNVVEYFSKTLNKWILIDPLFNMFISLPNSSPAGVKEIMKNWSYCSKQMPDDYSTKYKFLGVRYTNWEKMGFIGKSTYKIISFIFGKNYADSIALRPYFLSMYKVVALSLLYLYGTFLLFKFVIPRLGLRNKIFSLIK